MRNTVKFSIVVSKILRDRIDVLARKGLITRNKWIVRTLTRKARLKRLATNSKILGEPDDKHTAD